MGRCPRCGYVLRYDGYRYRCDFCGFTHMRRSWTQTVQDIERTLTNKFQSVLDSLAGPRFPQTVTYSPVWLRQQHPCVACGLNLQAGTQRCPRCGALQIAAPVNATPLQQQQSPDQRVLDYIVAHDGTISLSQAARDLSITPGELGSTIERLKSAGFLDQTEKTP